MKKGFLFLLFGSSLDRGIRMIPDNFMPTPDFDIFNLKKGLGVGEFKKSI